MTASRAGRPDLSTIVVTWRNAEVIARCLGSIRSAALEHPQEIIVVDNASDDGTPDVAATAEPGARVVKLPGNFGFAAANNAGLSHARGRYAALVNSDCFPDPGALDALVDALDESPAIGIVGGKLRYEDGRHQPSAGSLPTLRTELWLALGLHRAPMTARLGIGLLSAEALYLRARRVGWVTGAFCAFRPEVGLLPGEGFMYGEDVEWAAQAHAKGFEVRLEPRATAMHLNAYSVSRSLPRGFREASRVDHALRWFASRGPLPLAAERAILSLHALVRLVAAAALIPIRPRRGVANLRSSGALFRSALTRARVSMPRPARLP